MTVEQALDRLETSKFRAGFHLTEKEKAILEEKGMDVMRRHAEDFVRMKLAPSEPLNDGRQTPMHGHPVFKAMHGTACCCRGCLEKWYHVPRHRVLTEEEQRRIVELLLAWIRRHGGTRKRESAATEDFTRRQERDGRNQVEENGLYGR